MVGLMSPRPGWHWVLWDQICAMGTNSWERRRRQRTTPPASSQHVAGSNTPFGDSMIVLLCRGLSIFHPHLALAGHFSLGPEPEVLQVAFIFLGPGHSSSGSRSHLVGRLSVGQCNASVPFIHSAFSCCLHGCLLVSPKDTLSYIVFPKWNVVVDLDRYNSAPLSQWKVCPNW